MLLPFAMNARTTASVLLFGLLSTAAAQVSVDAPIELDGSEDTDRQVQGLRDGGQADEAVNTRTLRDAPYRYAEVSGTTAWTVHLEPPVTSVDAGLVLLLKSIDGVDGALSITVDGLGPFAVVKGGSSALEASDVAPGEVTHLVFDGIAFQLISARRQAKRPCPPGTAQVTEQFCVDIAERDTMWFADASVACGQNNGRLCTWGEWYNACVAAQSLGLQNMIGNYEWTNSAANGDGNVRVAGVTTCTVVGTAGAWVAPGRAFRCCYRR